jgi:hypothetical protein
MFEVRRWTEEESGYSCTEIFISIGKTRCRLFRKVRKAVFVLKTEKI